MSEDWSEKWYKHAFARSSAGKPKAEVWKQIESSLNGWFKRWYQSGSVGQSRQPKAEVWQTLSAYVDQGLLLRRQMRLRLLRSLSFAMVFVVLPLSLADQFAQNSEYGLTPAYLEDDRDTFTAHSGQVQHHTEQIITAEGNRRADVLEATPVLPAQHVALPILAELSENLGTTEQQDASEMVDRLSTRPLNQTAMPRTLAPDIALVGLAERPFNLPRWILAGSTLYQHSNLYNETTRMGFARTSHISNESKPNFSVDLALMRKLNTRSLLSLGVRINDVKGQTYLDFEGAEYLSKRLICTYQTVLLNYHHSLLRPGKTSRINLELSGGFYGSYRSGISESVGMEDRHFLSPGIRKFDVGLQCGIQSVFQITEPIQLTLGTYYTNGLINIFKGVDKVPANFYTSFTASYGLSLGLRYQLK